MCSQSALPGRDDLIVRVENGYVARLLVAKDAMLGRSVVHQSLVAIHVIRRHVQTERHRRMKIHYRLKLKTRNLDDCPAVVSRILNHRDECGSDVPSDLDR